MTKLTCMSWNILGLNDFRKARLVQTYLNRKNVDICLMEETHLTNASISKLKSNTWGHIYSANYSNYSRGVATLIKKGTPLSPIQVVTDPEGRYIMVLGSLYHKHTLIVNTYGPNTDDPEFYRQV